VARSTLLLVLVALLTAAFAQTENRIDLVRPDAPELAAFGDHAIGVRTLELAHADQVDVLRAQAGEPLPRYDRPLVVEVWYPADGPPAEPGAHAYTTVLRDGTTPATLYGRAQRDATPALEGGPFPLVIVSHGYPGNRFLLSHFGENLASKGYVVASIDHTDSTYSDQAAFGSTLLNRPIDQAFVIAELARLADDDTSFLAGLVDADRSGIIGYSMGGYGALNAIGAGFTEAAAAFGFSPPNEALRARQAGEPEYEASLDGRIRAIIAIAPWGMPAGFWDEAGLAAVTTPVMFMAGSADDVAGYERGARLLFERTRNADRYLLTFVNANHNAAGPIAPPVEVLAVPERFGHYADAVWENVRMNNVAQHFATAFFGLHLQGDDDFAPYLDLVEDAADGVVARDPAGNVLEGHTYWLGFPDRTAVGLRLEHALPE
jgi:predicted dienelactone hydrolase